MSHTPEPWHQCDDGNCGCGQILGPECVYVATIKDKQNRERIVTCVNACAGMRNDELEGGLLIGVMSKKIQRLKHELDALNMACKEIIAISDRQHDAWDRAKAVIARIEGGAA